MPASRPAAAPLPPVPVERLRSGHDIAAVFAARRRRGGELAVLHAHRPPGAAGGAVRVAVVASRKVGSAVRRNRAKRLLREAARRTPWLGGVDAVLVARPGCAASSEPAVRAEVLELAGALGVARRRDGATT